MHVFGVWEEARAPRDPCRFKPFSRVQPRVGRSQVSSLLFADDVVLLASLTHYLQIALGSLQPSVKHLGWKIASPSLRPWFSVGKGWSAHYWLPVSCYPKQMNILCKYLGVLFKNEGRMEQETDRWISTVISDEEAVPVCCVEERAEHENKAVRLSVNIFPPSPVVRLSGWWWTEWEWKQIVEKRFICKVQKLNLRDQTFGGGDSE